MKTELLDDLMTLTEEIKMDYNFTDRFLYFIYLRGNNQLEFQRELTIEMEEELNLLQNGYMKIPKITIDKDREFDEYNIVIQSTLLMCVRITNIRKLLYIANKFKNIFPKNLVRKLKYTLEVLQKEFKDAYGKYYIENEEYKRDYKFINGRNFSLVEYLINKDLNVLFQAKELAKDSFFDKHQKELYVYIAVIYLSLELEYLHSDVERIANRCKSDMDFIQYRKFIDLLQKELDLWHIDYMSTLQNGANYNILDKYRQTHQLIVIKDDNMK